MEGIKILEGWGFKVQYQKDIFAKKGYLAGDDNRRAKELIAALRDPKAQAILVARGGYGVMRLLPYLDRARLKPKPKLVIGYSDITPLLDYCHTRFGWPVFYGPSLICPGMKDKNDRSSRSALLKALTATRPFGTKKFTGMKIIRHGKAVAPIVGGCLTLICATLGTPYEMVTDNKIFFLEDTNEPPYKIDRMLTQMKLAGKFKKCRGVIFGSSLSSGGLRADAKIISDVLGEYKFPIVTNFPMGHSRRMITIPLGVKVEMNTKKKMIMIF